MEEKPLNTSTPEEHFLIEGDIPELKPAIDREHQETTEVDPQHPLDQVPALLINDEYLPLLTEGEREEAEQAEYSGSSTPQPTDEQSQDKGKEPDMSYPGDYYHYSRMSSGQSERRVDTSRSSTTSSGSSNASTPRQGSEPARGSGQKKDDRSGSGGGSSGGSSGAGGSTSGTGSGSGSGSGSGRSRLVAGVFVRY